MNLPSALRAELAKDRPRIGILFRLAGDPVGRFWAGIGEGNFYDPVAQADGRYYGMGELTKVPSVSQLINGKAERVVFSMSGISERVLQIANGEAVGVRGQDVRLMLIGFDADWQCLGPGVQLWRGEADYLTVSLDSNGGIQTRTVELSVGSLMTNRRRSPYSYFTDPDQQARSPGDIFCERTPLYQNSVGKKWP